MSPEKQKEILQAVWSVIARDGLAAVSVRSVATAAGVSPGRVQHYFPTKQDLVRSSVSAMLAGAARTTPEALGGPGEPVTLWALLTHAISPAASRRPGTSIYFSYVAASVTDPWIAEALTEARRGVQSEVGQRLRAQGATIEDIDGAAMDLTLMAEGATQAVFVGWCTPEEALARIRHALARLDVTIS